MSEVTALSLCLVTGVLAGLFWRESSLRRDAQEMVAHQAARVRLLEEQLGEWPEIEKKLRGDDRWVSVVLPGCPPDQYPPRLFREELFGCTCYQHGFVGNGYMLYRYVGRTARKEDALRWLGGDEEVLWMEEPTWTIEK